MFDWKEKVEMYPHIITFISWFIKIMSSESDYLYFMEQEQSSVGFHEMINKDKDVVE